MEGWVCIWQNLEPNLSNHLCYGQSFFVLNDQNWQYNLVTLLAMLAIWLKMQFKLLD